MFNVKPYGYDKMYMDKHLISNLWLIDGSVQWKKNQS